MALYEKTIRGNFNEIVDRLDKAILNSGMSMNFVDGSSYSADDFQLVVRVYDKYFARIGSRASLSLAVAGHGADVLITAIGAGGGKGIIYNSSWGAEEELVSIVQQSIRNMDQSSF